jgi:hypothetical protein
MLGLVFTFLKRTFSMSFLLIPQGYRLDLRASKSVAVGPNLTVIGFKVRYLGLAVLDMESSRLTIQNKNT